MGVGIVVLALGAAAVVGYVGGRLEQIRRVPDLTLHVPGEGEPTNFLLVGTDSREGMPPVAPRPGYVPDAGCNCTDTIIVLRLDPDGKHAYLLSLPRDLWVPISGTGRSARINTAYQHGVQTLIDTVQDNFDIPIHHYVQIDFVGFQRLVDAAGGVPLWFDAPVRDKKSGLRVPGRACQVLDGDQARRFVRSRHLEYQRPDGTWVPDGTADLGRISRQQAFMRQVASKVVSEGLGNPVTLNRLVSSAVSNVSVDASLAAGDLLRIGRTFAAFDSDNLLGYSLQGDPVTTSGGAAVLIPRMRQAQSTLNLFRGEPPGTLSPESINVRVRNGSTTAFRAADAAGALQRIGFTVVGANDFDRSDVARTTVRYAPGGEPRGRLVASHLTGGAALEEAAGLGPNQVVVIIGADFTTVHDQPAPEGSPDDRRTTTSTATTVTGPSSTTSTTAPGTAPPPVGYVTGEPPDGVDC